MAWRGGQRVRQRGFRGPHPAPWPKAPHPCNAAHCWDGSHGASLPSLPPCCQRRPHPQRSRTGTRCLGCCNPRPGWSGCRGNPALPACTQTLKRKERVNCTPHEKESPKSHRARSLCPPSGPERDTLDVQGHFPTRQKHSRKMGKGCVASGRFCGPERGTGGRIQPLQLMFATPGLRKAWQFIHPTKCAHKLHVTKIKSPEPLFQTVSPSIYFLLSELQLFSVAVPSRHNWRQGRGPRFLLQRGRFPVPASSLHPLLSVRLPT